MIDSYNYNLFTPGRSESIYIGKSGLKNLMILVNLVNNKQCKLVFIAQLTANLECFKIEFESYSAKTERWRVQSLRAKQSYKF